MTGLPCACSCLQENRRAAFRVAVTQLPVWHHKHVAGVKQIAQFFVIHSTSKYQRVPGVYLSRQLVQLISQQAVAHHNKRSIRVSAHHLRPSPNEHILPLAFDQSADAEYQPALR